MRIAALDKGHTLGKKALFVMMRLMMRVPVPDVVKTLMYRPDFFGASMGEVFQAAMRGPSDWTVAEREMMASYISKANECEF
jgi:hypothetical protein